MIVKELKNFLETEKDTSVFRELTPSKTVNTRFYTNVIYSRDNRCIALVAFEGSNKKLTVKDIKDFIEVCDEIHDDDAVTVDEAKLLDNNSNIVRWFAGEPNGPFIGVNAKRDEDVENELRARSEAAVDEGWSDADLVQSAFDSGFTLDDFRYEWTAYQFAKKAKERYGLIELRERLGLAS